MDYYVNKEEAIKNNYYYYGYLDLNRTKKVYFKFGNYNFLRFYNEKTSSIYYVYKPTTIDKLEFCSRIGYYIEKEYIKNYKNFFPKMVFPYGIEQEYEAIYNLSLFQNSYKVSLNKKVPFSKALKRSFGIEFETCCGVIPENECYENGLIPLKDGSISGVEYASVVMKGQEGLNLLKQQLNCLKKYTAFNKECSLHIHFGDIKINKENIFVLYCLLYYLQGEISKYLPKEAFTTSTFKKTNKDYSKSICYYKTFEDLYSFVANKKYEGSLTDPHPNDIKRTRKWNVTSRYYWANFVNLLCYDSPKTIEFRMLMPTYNYTYITTWLYILNAIISYAERIHDKISFKNSDDLFDYFSEKKVTINSIIEYEYSALLANKINNNIENIYCSVLTQEASGDFFGCRADIHDLFLK